MQLDIIILTRDGSEIEPTVLQAIQGQSHVEIELHRVIGSRRSSDENRWQTIARARNIGKTLGQTPWVMFVDDDVVLGDQCIATLLDEIESRELDAIAADYLGEAQVAGSNHVGMGATLFRRDVLDQMHFRSTSKNCECQCMVDDLRQQGFHIAYSHHAHARHLTESAKDHSVSDSDPLAPVVMTAFDRSHLGLFVGRFLRTLRASGNSNAVHAVTYGLREKDIRRLEELPGVKVYPQPSTRFRVCQARMIGFQEVLQQLPPKTPAVYWDAGDVLFQTRIDALWDLVHSSSDRLLVVEEPLRYEDNIGHQTWIDSIQNTQSRAEASRLLNERSVINGGFMAGTTGRLLEYFGKAQIASRGPLLGAGGGDQVILNVAKYETPSRFQVVHDTWNYCLAGRSGKECKIRGGRYWDIPSGRPVSVVHGNARTIDS